MKTALIILFVLLFMNGCAKDHPKDVEPLQWAPDPKIETNLEREVWNALGQFHTPPRTKQQAVFEALLPIIKRIESIEDQRARCRDGV